MIFVDLAVQVLVSPGLLAEDAWNFRVLHHLRGVADDAVEIV